MYVNYLICAVNQGSPFCNLAIVVLRPLVALEPSRQCRRTKRCRFSPWVRKIPWRRAWHPLQCSCLENPVDRGAWWTIALGVAESDMTETT